MAVGTQSDLMTGLVRCLFTAIMWPSFKDTIMRYATLSAAFFLGMGAVTAIAQAPGGQDSGARPGHAIGVGDSLPRSDKASNINAADTKTTVAPTLPASAIGTNATAKDYLRAARASLVAGQTGATQQQLEMAETRALDRSVPMGQTDQPVGGSFVSWIGEARAAVGSGDRPHAIQLIDMALAS